jgi:uridine kinase
MGHPAQVPIYDFASHSRRGARWLDPRRILLVDGLWLLRRPKLRRLFDFAVFLDVSMSRRLYLRVKRDVSERGRSAASVREQFRCMVEPMHRKYVAPQARWADLVLARNCTVAQLARIAARIPNLKS